MDTHISVVLLWAVTSLPISTAIGKEPTLGSSSELSASLAAIRSGDFIAGSEMLLSEIRRCPNHPSREVQSRFPLDAEKLAHGRKQFSQMIADRPVLRVFATAELESMKKWAIRQFAGESIGYPVYWNNSPLPEGVGASSKPKHCAPEGKAYLRLGSEGRSNRDDQAEFLWSGLVFEFFNLRNGPEFQKLDDSAFQGRISRNEFVREVFALEHKAIQLRHFYYANTYLPSVDGVLPVSNPRYWHTDVSWWGSLSDRLAKYKPHLEYPWGVYGHRFRQCTDHWAESNVENQEKRLPRRLEAPRGLADLKEMDPVLYSGVHSITLGKLMIGRRTLTDAIQNRSYHWGNLLPTKFSIDKSAKEHGELQVDSMSKSCREFKVLNTGPFKPLANWAARQFAGEGVGFRVAWSRKLRRITTAMPRSVCSSVFMLAPTVNLHDNLENSPQVELGTFEQMWSRLVLNLFCLQGLKRARELEAATLAGELTRNEYVEEMLSLDRHAIQKLHRYYVQEYLPWANDVAIPSNPFVWYLEADWWKTPAEQLSGCPQNSGYPRGVYGKQYRDLQQRWDNSMREKLRVVP